VARAISSLTENKTLKSVGMELWDGATEQLFSDLAASLSKDYFSQVGLKLTCVWSGCNVKTMWIETVDGRKWTSSTASLMELYPMESLISTEEALMREAVVIREMSELAGNPVSESTPGSSECNISIMESSSTIPLAASDSDAPEIVSVVVPATYPSSGQVVTIASPATGRTADVIIPPGSLPGGQFLIQFDEDCGSRNPLLTDDSLLSK
jgi:hypothetical protein